MVKSRRAVAGLLCAQGEVLLVKRHVNAPAFPGYWACPGGKVEKHEAPPPAREAFCGLESETLAALQREFVEELGIDIYQLPCTISRLGNAVTPASSPRRFDTDFFRIDLAAKPDITLDTHEHLCMRWDSASTFWAEYLAGDLLCVAPLQRLLEQLSTQPDATMVPGLGHRPGRELGLDLVEPLHGLRILPLRSNTLPPATHTNCFILGDTPANTVLVDPSPGSPEVYAQLTGFLDSWGQPSSIFITHHHPDHHERAPQLARELGVPLQMSAATRANIDRRWGPSYLEGIDIQLLGDGDTLCTWKAQPVRLIAVPGHDNGHMALMPDSAHWMIVGDLYQGVGTVVIGRPEGNMGEYFASLRKVIALRPGVTVPSHGIALPGTLQVERTLQHRQQREDRIRSLHEQGHDVDAILAREYAQVPKALWPLARMNIEGHLEKIDAERM